MTFPFHPKTSIQILNTVFFIFSYGTDMENLFDNQELIKLVIISFIPVAFSFDFCW